MTMRTTDTSRPAESSPLAYTIVTRNHFFLAAALAENFRDTNPTGRFLVVVADADDPVTGEAAWDWLAPQHQDWKERVSGGASLGPQNLRSAGQLCPDEHWELAFQYQPLELTCCLKGRVAESLLRAGETKLLYMDADTRIFDSVENCLAPLRADGGVLLTPHLRNELPQDGCYPTNVELLRSGVFNGGVLGIVQKAGATDDAKCFLNWWNRCNRFDCIVDPYQGLFVDQRWLDQAPAYFSSVKISRHLGLNVGYWNLHDRRVTRRGGQWLVTPNGSTSALRDASRIRTALEARDDVPLQVFHFSGAGRVTPDGANCCHRLSRHQNRHGLKTLGEVPVLLDQYLSDWLEHQWLDYQVIPYAYDKLPNGIEISPPWREAFRLNSCRIREAAQNPFLAFTNAKARSRLEEASNAKYLKDGRFQYHLEGLHARIENLKHRLDQLPWRRLLRASQELHKRWFRKAG
jgi:hypothetical protein